MTKFRDVKKREHDKRESLVIHFFSRLYTCCEYFTLPFVMYSIIFTPIEFGFYQGLPRNFLVIIDKMCFVVFLFDFIIRRCHWCLKYFSNPNSNTKPCIILLWIIVEAFSVISYDLIYKIFGKKEVQFLLVIRIVSWLLRICRLFRKKGKGIHNINCALKIGFLIIIYIYLVHIFACILYYMATTLPESQEGDTWLGSLEINHKKEWTGFRNISFLKKYIISMYFATITMRSIGYGEIKPANDRERVVTYLIKFISWIYTIYLAGSFGQMIAAKYDETEKKEKNIIIRDPRQDASS